MDVQKETKEEARFFDHLATLEERKLAVNRDCVIHSVLSFLVFSLLGYAAWGDVPTSLLLGLAPVVIVIQSCRLRLLIISQELDRMLFSYGGDMELLHRGLAVRRDASSMLARQRYYYRS